MEGTINVTTQELRSVANEFSSIMSQVRGLADNMLNQVNGLSAKWQGDASQAYLTKFGNLNDDIAKLGALINEHVQDLNAMANEYDAKENKNVEIANTLAGDVI